MYGRNGAENGYLLILSCEGWAKLAGAHYFVGHPAFCFDLDRCKSSLTIAQIVPVLKAQGSITCTGYSTVML